MEPLSHPGRALVVYESMFGDTRAITNTIAAGLLSRFGRVDVVSTDAAPVDLGGVDLFDRRSADSHVRPAALVDSDGGHGRVVLTLSPKQVKRVAGGVAGTSAFGRRRGFRHTRPRADPGSARRGIARRVRGLGMHHSGQSKGFSVTRNPGPPRGEFTAGRPPLGDGLRPASSCPAYGCSASCTRGA